MAAQPASNGIAARGTAMRKDLMDMVSPLQPMRPLAGPIPEHSPADPRPITMNAPAP
jgi:hypothetical protein